MEETGFYAPTVRRFNAFEVFLKIREAQRQQRPTAVIRLGDGEGMVLGYPEITGRTDVEFFLQAWLRRTNVPNAEVFSLRDHLRQAIEHADVLGIPRLAQVRRDRRWAAVGVALAKLDVEADLTQTALHRLMSHALLFRPLLRDQPFVGLISCRDVRSEVRRLFGVRQTRWYGVRGGSRQARCHRNPTLAGWLQRDPANPGSAISGRSLYRGGWRVREDLLSLDQAARRHSD